MANDDARTSAGATAARPGTATTSRPASARSATRSGRRPATARDSPGKNAGPADLHPAKRLLKASLVAGATFIGGTVVTGLLTVAEGFWARDRLLARAIPEISPQSGMFGTEKPGEPLRLALLGDSLAVGLGAANLDETIGVILAKGLADAARRPVRLSNVAVIGSESKHLVDQFRALAAQGMEPEVAVIIVGGNEIMHLQNIRSAVSHLSDAVAELRRRGCQVVVATCPDMGTVRPFLPPLRFVTHWLSRVLATAQTIVVLRAGGRTVSLADTLGPVFRSKPTLMFSPDHLHPSSAGYARAGEVLLPSLRAAAGYRTDDDASVPHRIYRKNPRTPLLAWLAFRATRHAGVESHTTHSREEHRIDIGRRTLGRLHSRIRLRIRRPRPGLA